MRHGGVGEAGDNDQVRRIGAIYRDAVILLRCDIECPGQQDRT